MVSEAPTRELLLATAHCLYGTDYDDLSDRRSRSDYMAGVFNIVGSCKQLYVVISELT